MKTTRREVLVTIAAVATASPAAGQDFLTTAELAGLTALADAIIPRTDTPGASDAGVPAVITRRLLANSQLGERFRTGLQALDMEAQSRFHAAFAALSPAQQIELLTPRQQDPFFRMMKDMTVEGYYSSQAGLSQELGWHGNTFLTEFKGCTHPEHQK